VRGGGEDTYACVNDLMAWIVTPQGMGTLGTSNVGVGSPRLPARQGTVGAREVFPFERRKGGKQGRSREGRVIKVRCLGS
jgi:hypothetical protein